MATPSEQATETIKCPRCGAKPGDLCVSTRGGSAVLTYIMRPHRERMKRWRKHLAAQEEQEQLPYVIVRDRTGTVVFAGQGTVEVH